MPSEVRDAVHQGLKVHRQGDWFFVPFEGQVPSSAYVVRNSQSSHRFPLEGSHYPEEVAKWVDHEDHHRAYIVVRGKVSHRSDHAPLELGSIWHLPYRNAAVRNPRQTFDNRVRVGVD